MIARAVADGIGAGRPGAVVECRSVDEARVVPAGLDLVVLGAPTHFWGLTRGLSRRAEDQYERRLMRRPGTAGGTTRRAAATTGMRTFLSVLPPGAGRPAATFDTRMTGRLTGGARRALARSLENAGYRVIAPPETFVVEAVAGPLRAGEVARAHAWGASLVRALEHPDTHSRRQTMQAVHDERPTHDGSTATAPQAEPTDPPGGRRSIDLVRVVTTTELVVGAVLVARYLSRRPGAA